MKRLYIALTTIGITLSGLAALPAATDPTVVMVPQLPGGFVIGGSAFYMEALPTHGDLDYATVNFGDLDNLTILHSKVKDVEPGYNWGWGLNIGYIFPNTGNDVNLSYFQLDTDDRDHINVGSTDAGFFLVPINPQTLDPEDLNDFLVFAAAKAEYDIEQADLTAGQFIDVGCRLIAHPYAGLRWMRIDRDLDSFYSSNTPGNPPGNPPNATLFEFERSDFNGIGPIVGLDASYYLYMGFGAIGHFDSALLVGDIDTRNTTFASQAGGINFFGEQYRIEDNNHVVPVVDAKLGLDYTYVFNNCENSDLTLEVGWQVSKYFNSVNRLYTSINIIGDNENFILNRRTSDVGLSGPYVSLVFHA